MQTAWQRELDYTISLLQHMRVQARLVHPEDALSELDGGLRKLLGVEVYYDDAYRIANRWSSPRTIYKILDQFMCCYIYFQLPAVREPAAVVIGPYLTLDLSRETLLELAEHLNLPLHLLPQLVDHYASLPVYPDPSALMAIVSTLGETIWGGAAFDMIDVDYEQRVSVPASVSVSAPIEQENILQRMQQMEKRYAFENELMEIVSKGLTNIGMIDGHSLCMEGVNPVKGYFGGPIKRKPGVQISVASFDGECALCIWGYAAAVDIPALQTLLDKTAEHVCVYAE